MQLDDSQRTELIHLLSETEVEVQVMDQRHDQTLDSILLFYTVRKRKLEQNPSYYLQLFDIANEQGERDCNKVYILFYSTSKFEVSMRYRKEPMRRVG